MSHTTSSFTYKRLCMLIFTLYICSPLGQILCPLLYIYINTYWHCHRHVCAYTTALYSSSDIDKFCIPWSVGRTWPQLYCLFPWVSRWSRMNCSVSDSLYQMAFLIARLPKRNNWWFGMDSLEFGGNNDMSKRYSLVSIFGPAIDMNWHTQELSSLRFQSSYTGLSQHTQELCLFIAAFLVIYFFIWPFSYTTTGPTALSAG